MKYQCPGCTTTMNVHQYDCQYEGTSIHDIEKAHIDIISLLVTRPHSKFDLLQKSHGDWSDLHTAVWENIKGEGRVEKIGTIEQEGGEWNVWRLLTADEYMEKTKIPRDPDLQTIWNVGPVEGCRDNALYSMMCYYARSGFDWEQTQDLLMEWLERTGWEHGWDGDRAERHIHNKKHVYDNQYHWSNKARVAAEHIRNHM